MNCLRCLGVCLFLGLGVSTGFAQLDVKLSQTRTDYLLYEPMEFTVTLTNITNEALYLSRDTDSDKAWLSFMVFRADKSKVREESAVNVSPVKLGPGQSVSVATNITPNYDVRATGTYTIQAVIALPGRTPLITVPLYFNVGKGEEIWHREEFVNGTKRVYTLVRFLEREDSNLYLRVEEPSENVVYNTVRLGKITAYTNPQVLFDSQRRVHIIHTIGSRTTRYSVLDADGHLQTQEDRLSGVPMPTMLKDASGTVTFSGGVPMQEKKKQRQKLSETQQGLM